MTDKIDLDQLDERARLDGYRVILPIKAEELFALVRAVKAARLLLEDTADLFGFEAADGLREALAAFTDSAEWRSDAD